jgi:hypothetical protein
MFLISPEARCGSEILCYTNVMLAKFQEKGKGGGTELGLIAEMTRPVGYNRAQYHIKGH